MGEIVADSFELKTKSKNPIVAYLLWFFLGFFGMHRFYMGRPKSALFQIILLILGLLFLIFLIGYLFLIALAIWVLLDAYFLYTWLSASGSLDGGLSIATVKRNSIETKLDTLKKLKTLRDEGVIAEDEFQAERDKLVIGS